MQVPTGPYAVPPVLIHTVERFPDLPGGGRLVDFDGRAICHTTRLSLIVGVEYKFTGVIGVADADAGGHQPKECQRTNGDNLPHATLHFHVLPFRQRKIPASCCWVDASE